LGNLRGRCNMGNESSKKEWEKINTTPPREEFGSLDQKRREGKKRGKKERGVEGRREADTFGINYS